MAKAETPRADVSGNSKSQLFAGNVAVQYGQAYVELAGSFDGDMDKCFAGQRNGICGAHNPAILFLVTGLHTGVVGLTIELFETDPGVDDTWEEVVEVSFEAPNGAIELVEWSNEEGVRLPLSPGQYRARYHGRAMQAANDLDTNVDDTPVDTYRLDIWSAHRAKDQVVKQTSEISAYWHDWASKLDHPKP